MDNPSGSDGPIVFKSSWKRGYANCPSAAAWQSPSSSIIHFYPATELDCPQWGGLEVGVSVIDEYRLGSGVALGQLEREMEEITSRRWLTAVKKAEACGWLFRRSRRA